MLHMGTLVGMVFVLWPDLVRIIRAGFASLRDRAIAADPDRRLAWLLLVSVVPAAVLGAALEPFFDTYFREMPIAIAGLVLVGAGALWLGERHGRRQRTLDDLRLRDAIIVGGAQALALFPGICAPASRSPPASSSASSDRPRPASGSSSASRSSPVPASGSCGRWPVAPIDFQPLVLLAGVMGSAVAGFLAVTLLLRYLQNHSTAIFIAYRIGLAVVIVIWALAA